MRASASRATCVLVALICVCGACANILGFDDLRVGDASLDEAGNVGDGFGMDEGGTDVAGEVEGLFARDAASSEVDAGSGTAIQDGTTIGDGSGASGEGGDRAADVSPDAGLDGGADATSDAGSGAPSGAGVDANDGGGITVGLVAFYPFDETSGTSAADASGNNRTASLVGGATFSSGLQNNAVTLSGSNQYVSLPSGIATGLTSFSICAWVNLSSSNASTPWTRIFDFGTGTTTYMFLTPNNGPAPSMLRFSITTGGTGQEQQITAPSPATGSWQHVAVTLTATTGTLYVNGAEVAQNTNVTLNPASLGTTTQNWLGRSQFPGDPYLSGQIDNFRIYDRALSAAEVQTLYAGHL